MITSRFTSAVAAFSITFAVAPPASAFCRKRAIPAAIRKKHSANAPKLEDRVDKQCTTTCEDDQFEDFKPYPYLYWPGACVSFSVSTTLAGEIGALDASDLVARSFSQWSGARCPTATGDARPSIDIRDFGGASCTTPGYDKSGGPNQNLIYSRDSWDALDGKGGKASYADTLGLTTVSYDDDGRIVDADMQFDMQRNPALEKDTVSTDRFDLRSIVTHELGHFIGFVHSCDENAVMYWSANKGETKKRYLADDDRDAVCSTYKPGGERALTLDGSKSVMALPCDPTPRNGFTEQCQAAPKNCALSPNTSSGAATAAPLLVALLSVARRRRARAPRGCR